MTLRAGQEVNIQKAHHPDGCRLEIAFSDGHIQFIDFERFLRQAHPELRKYLDPKQFSGFSIEYGNLVWNDYDMCFPIEALYTGTLINSESERLKVVEDAVGYEASEPSSRRYATCNG